MKKIILGLILGAACVPAMAADVGVSISVGEPGFYGVINLGSAPPPRVIYEQPVVIVKERVRHAPLYLRVPPGHEKHWDKHCGEYHACERQVYFVRDDWYEKDYVPYHRNHHDDDHDHDGDHDGDHGKGKGHGKGRKHGKGHGKD